MRAVQKACDATAEHNRLMHDLRALHWQAQHGDYRTSVPRAEWRQTYEQAATDYAVRGTCAGCRRACAHVPLHDVWTAASTYYTTRS
jgi:hypothetical protein